MGKQSSSSKPRTTRSLAKTPKRTAKPSQTPSRVPTKAPGIKKKKKKVAKPLPEWSEQDDEEFQGLLGNMLSQRKRRAGPPTTPTTPTAIAYREAIRTRQAGRARDDGDADDEEGDEEGEQHGSETADGDDDDGGHNGDSEGSGEEEEGSEAEEGSDAEEESEAGDDDEARSTKAAKSRAGVISGFQHAMKETDPDLDEEEEIEMRTIKGKGKAKVSGPIKFAGLIMLRRKCPQDGSAPKPTAQEIDQLEKCGLAVTRTKEPWLELPSNATYEELDQVFSEMLSDPFEHLHRRSKNNVPVWELLIPRNRLLHRRTEDSLPEAADVQRSWTVGRAIRDKKIYIAPTVPFPKDAFAALGLNASESTDPSSTGHAGPSSSRKRKINSPGSEEKENNEVAVDDESERRRKKPRLDAASDNLDPGCGPSRPGLRSTAGKVAEEIDLTADEVTETTVTPLREKQPPRIFVHKSPSKEFNPYADPGCYFK